MNLRITLFTILSLSIILTGCAGWRAAREVPVVASPESFHNSQSIRAYNDSKWWTEFSDSSLNNLMDLAFSENLTIRQAVARLQQVQANYASARASWFPTLNAAVKLQDNGAVGDATLNPSQNLSTYDVRLNTAYEIDLWGRLAANRTASVEDLMASESDTKALLLNISSQLAQTYYRIIELRQQVELADFTIQVYQASLDMVEGRYNRGIVPSLDVYQAQVSLAGAKARKAQLETAQAQIEHALSVLLGRYPAINSIISANLFPDNVPHVAVGLPSELVQRRPDVQAAYHRLIATDRRWAEAVANRYPSFSLTSSVGAGSDDLADALDPNSMVWNAIGNLTLPIFEGGRRKANADRAEAVYAEYVGRYKEAVLNGFKDVEDALVENRNNETRVTELQRQESAAENSLQIATERYLSGLTTYLNVVTAQSAYFTARSSLLTARRELLDSRIGLASSLGGGWTEEILKDKIADVVVQ